MSPAQEVVNKAITPHQDTTHEVAPTTTTHPLVTGYQDNTETPADLEKKKMRIRLMMSVQIELTNTLQTFSPTCQAAPTMKKFPQKTKSLLEIVLQIALKKLPK